ncbi:hypothetical protein ESY86_04220 [Subsaximicrobium wynnwilliamsii]|uniref:Letm1 RBD domain-containing protein n=1 Tax=Subsaximicrobium wynnwilliamsii TaxID=291179 RepID=A0A5C6ZPK1_9FLAO|nr:LETM1-related biofilm-associated protein [Subsaximicrobium wynnwilliamsii]TXD84909.1 hypothetical protein ESY87_04000 [Subsaximicrobium wynnwilliamsii]TXD90580.1 hypothetical protein ESY86_04220 [Subsaximicrobium wynnwilliamsii]TXE05054.1 hypothetical protein ESY88_02525 [Subsaximicrobium wynnwilliamsii]
MNPSTNGWIENFCSRIAKQQLPFSNFDALYDALKTYGFIYGVNVSCVAPFATKNSYYSEDELAKINLITAMYHVYAFRNRSVNDKSFSITLLEFYETLEISDFSRWDKFFIGKSQSARLERLINDRVSLEDSTHSKNFNKSFTNSLLCVDVFIFKLFLEKSSKNINLEIKSNAAYLEQIIVGTLYQSLNSRGEITIKDKAVVDMIEASKAFDDRKAPATEDLIYNIDYNISQEEKIYLLDLVCLSVRDDEFMDATEFEFLIQLANRLELKESDITNAMKCVTSFRKAHKKTILLLQQTNPISNFFDNSYRLVNKLIRRNSKRLVKELRQSKDLLALITKSTHTDLTKEEQKRMQSQLLEILKTIPSLAIFMLPGGAILLPIFAKLIPNLLPSAFDDNHIEK